MTPNTLETLGAIALDLRRASMAFWEGSLPTARRFVAEAVKRKAEISGVAPYVVDTLTELSLDWNDDKARAEDLLMRSTIIQNYVVAHMAVR